MTKLQTLIAAVLEYDEPAIGIISIDGRKISDIAIKLAKIASVLSEALYKFEDAADYITSENKSSAFIFDGYFIDDLTRAALKRAEEIASEK